jgi:hypothetical protein
MIIFYYSQSAVKFSKLVWTRESRDLLLSHPKREFMHELSHRTFFTKTLMVLKMGCNTISQPRKPAEA